VRTIEWRKGPDPADCGNIHAGITSAYGGGADHSACPHGNDAMGREAENVYTDQHDIALLEARAGQLPDEARVDIVLVDGSRVTGTVAARPTLQTFFDEDGREGVNGVVRIDDHDEPGRAHYLWLDRILEIVVLGTA
jgi:Protein of unknown function (DUF3247)